MYTVIERFKDLKHEHTYEVGEVFPKEGKAKPTPARLKKLMGDNPFKTIFIEKAEEPTVVIEPVDEVGEVDEPTE